MKTSKAVSRGSIYGGSIANLRFTTAVVGDCDGNPHAIYTAASVC
jgi:hypothetical protein